MSVRPTLSCDRWSSLRSASRPCPMSIRQNGRKASGARRGVTLLELLIVITLISMLLGAGVGVLARLDVGKRAAHGMVQSVVRSASTSALARQASARVSIDTAAGKISASGMKVIGTWHFEDETLPGAFDINGTMLGAVLIDDGYIGKGISFSGTSRSAYAEFPVHKDPAFDLGQGFAIDCAVRLEERGAGQLFDLGGAIGLEWSGQGLLQAWFRPELTDETGRTVRGGRVLAQAPAGALDLGKWHRIHLSYDRTELVLAVDGNVIARSDADTPVWQLEGPMVVGDPRRSFPGSLDALVVAGVVATETVDLPENVTFGPESVKEIRFAPGGHLDRARHPEPLRIWLDYADGKREVVRVGRYGTVE